MEPTLHSRANRFTLQWEGGYVNDPDDAGGATNKGITWRVYNAWRKAKGLAIRSVRFITGEEVDQIYKRWYWEPAHCDEIAEKGGEKLAIAVYDFAVNSGVKRAIEYLQRTVGAADDGVWGPKTAKRVEGQLLILGDRAVTTTYINRRESFFRAIAKGRNRKFLKGWLNRLNDLRDELEL